MIARTEGLFVALQIDGRPAHIPFSETTSRIKKRWATVGAAWRRPLEVLIETERFVCVSETGESTRHQIAHLSMPLPTQQARTKPQRTPTSSEENCDYLLIDGFSLSGRGLVNVICRGVE